MAPTRRAGSRTPSLPPAETGDLPAGQRRSPRKHGSVDSDSFGEHSGWVPVNRMAHSASKGTPGGSRELRALGITSTTRLNQSFSYGSPHAGANQGTTESTKVGQKSIAQTIKDTRLPVSQKTLSTIPEAGLGRQSSVESEAEQAPPPPQDTGSNASPALSESKHPLSLPSLTPH